MNPTTKAPEAGRRATRDRAPKRREPPPRATRAERRYHAQLRAVAHQVGVIVKGFGFEDPADALKVDLVLQRYSEALGTWAESAAAQMLRDVNAVDRNAWDAYTKALSQAVGDEIRNAPVGETLRALQAEQVTLIKSLPLQAAQRVHAMTLKGIEDGTRFADIAAEIRRTGDVTESRATLIARTEVARAASLLTQARATHVGSEGYVWRTSHDGDVRSSHREMEGKFVRWDDPPLLSDGTRTHAGQIFNCRCWPEAVLPDLHNPRN